MADRYRPPLKPVRVRVIVDGEVTSDTTAEDYSTWNIMTTVLKMGGYEFKLKEFKTVDGWLSYTCVDGTLVQAQVVT